MRRHRNVALAAVAGAVACLIAGCGGAKTESAKIAEVIKHGLVTTNPADCTGLMTHAYLLQNHLGTDQTVLRMCMQDLRDPTGNPHSVDVAMVQIAGALATANAAIRGGDLDGQTLRLRLRKDAGRWRLDRIEAFATFNRTKFLAGVMADFSSGSGALSRPLASCVVGRMGALADAKLEAIELGDDHTPLLRLVTGCARSARTRLPAARAGTATVTRPRGRPVADPVARPGAVARGPVAGVCQPAAVERQAAAADALRQTELEPLELGDPCVDPGSPALRKAGPVSPPGCPVAREPRELDADLLERQPNPLGVDDEGDPPEHAARIATVLAGAGPHRGDQAACLVETQR